MSTNPLTYQDLDVEVSTVDADGSFQVSIANGAISALTAGAAEISIYDPDAIPEGSNSQKSATTLLNRLSRRRAAHEELVELGTRLADLILPGRLRDVFLASLEKARQEGQGLRLRLQIGSDVLTGLPWELLHVQISPGEPSSGEFLAQMPDVSVARKGIASQVKVIETATPVEKIRLSAVLASPWGLDELDLEKEERVILSAAAAVDESGEALQVMLLGSLTEETPPSTGQEFSAGVVGAHIFYFAGHGRFVNNGESQIFLEDENGDPDAVSANELAGILDGAGVRLAVLGNCDGGRKGGADSWSGVATVLLAENIPAVLTFQDTMRERNATVFVAVLLARLLAGYTIDEAVFESRQAIVAADQGGRERDWMVPSLYLRTGDGYLFPLPEESTGSSDYEASFRIRQQLRKVEDSSVIGLKAQEMLEGDVRIEQIVEELKGSSLVGASLGSIDVGVTSQSLDSDEQTALHHKLEKQFNLGELNVLAVDLGIDYENLPGETVKEKGMELVLYCERHGHMAELMDRLHQLRPKVSW